MLVNLSHPRSARSRTLFYSIAQLHVAAIYRCPLYEREGTRNWRVAAKAPLALPQTQGHRHTARDGAWLMTRTRHAKHNHRATS